METGKWIRFYREQAGYSQKELGALLHLGERTIGHYETGTRMPSMDKLNLLANALEVDVQDLLSKTKKSNEDWYDYFFNEKINVKNMDERRFKMIVERLCSYEDTKTIRDSITESEENIIMMESYQFSKSLSKALLSLSNEYLVFHEIWKYNNEWEIAGLLADDYFKIYIKESDDIVKVNVKNPISLNNWSLEYKEIIQTIIKWVEIKFFGKKTIYNLICRLYIEDLKTEDIKNEPIGSINFSQRTSNGLKDVSTIGKLFQLRDEEIRNLPLLGSNGFFEVQDFKEMVMSRFINHKWVSFIDLKKEKDAKRGPEIDIEDLFKSLRERSKHNKNILGERRSDEEIERLWKDREEKLKEKERKKQAFIQSLKNDTP